MKTAPEASINLDGAGMAVSALCAVHCVVMPLIVGSLAAAGIGWLHNEALEWLILGSSLTIGLRALLPAFRHRHGKKRCLWLFSGGMASILLGRLAQHGSLPDTPFVIFGAVLIISAHAMNHYFCARCQRCG
ncbi:MAG: MerC domain-containing protein [Acidobacteriia bacterium]|nr:MerC domain-containing protein [Terriglobia bacterium]